MTGNGWRNWCLGTNTEMLSGESGLASVLNLVHISVLPAERGNSLSSLQDQELHWPEINCSWVCWLDVSCVSFAFFFPSLWGVMFSHQLQQVQHPSAQVCAGTGQLSTGQHLCRKAPWSPWDVSAPWRVCALAQRHLTLHPVPSCRLGLQQAPAELLWHNLPALKAATASASFDPDVLGMFSVGQNWKYGKLLFWSSDSNFVLGMFLI